MSTENFTHLESNQLFFNQTQKTVAIKHTIVPILVEQILTGFYAINCSKIKDHNFTKLAIMGVHCRNESVTPKLLNVTVVSGGAHLMGANYLVLKPS